MAVSGSTDYAPTAGDLIRGALKRINGMDLADSDPQTAESEFARLMLNQMLKGWQAKGVTLSEEKETSFSLVTSTASYALTPRALEVSAVRYRSTSDIDTPLAEIDRKRYFDIPNKASESARPNSYYFERARATSTIHLWPTPSASSGSVRYSYREVVDDVDALTDEVDLGQEWMECVEANLALRLAETPEFSMDGERYLKLKMRADELADEMFGFARTDSVFFLPRRA